MSKYYIIPRLILAICLLVVCGSAWAESEYLLTHTNECKHLIVPVNRRVLLSQNIVGNEDIVAKTIAMESASKPEGMPYVAITLYNRALKRGTSMSEEALRRKQYSCWNSQKWAKRWLSRHYGASVQLQARLALAKGLEMRKKGIGEGITHYHTVSIRPYWAKGHTPAFILGGHNWYRGIK